jgi:hypothetical protein
MMTVAHGITLGDLSIFVQLRMIQNCLLATMIPENVTERS